MGRGILGKLVMFFSITMALGIFVAYSNFANVVDLPQAISLSDFTLWDGVVIVAFLVAFFVIVTRFKKVATWMFRLFFVFLVFIGTQLVLDVWLGMYASTTLSTLIAVASGIFRKVFVQNIAMILAMSGIGANLGLSLTPISVVVLLLILSFYDILAVYGPGTHMVRMAESMIGSKSVLGFVVPEKTQQLTASMSNVSFGQGTGFMILGSGDVILPLIFASSLIRQSLITSITVGIFGFMGLLLMFFLFSRQQVRRPMAALPPIAMMTILGFLIVSIL